MKKISILLAVFPLIMCNGQNKSQANEFANSADLKGKVWHVGKSRVINKRGGIIFSTDVYLHFLDKESLQMTYSQYTPSVGSHNIKESGIYRVERKNEVSIVLFEPKDVFGRSKITIGESEVPRFFLYAMSRIRNPDEPTFDITRLPKIKTYHFSITNYLPNGDFRAELTLLDDKQVSYRFGTYTFDNNKTGKQP